MSTQYARQLERQRFIAGLTLTGTAGLLGLPSDQALPSHPPRPPLSGCMARGSALRLCMWLRSCSGARGSRTCSTSRFRRVA